MTTRIVLDVCVWSQAWFRNILPDLSEKADVVFVFSKCGKYSEELDRTRQLQDFLKIQLMLGRADVAPNADVLHYENYLNNNFDFCSYEQCDDPHIFSIVRVKGVRLVFTSDLRMERCRKRMQKKIAKEFLNFRIIATREQFDQRRLELGL